MTLIIRLGPSSPTTTAATGGIVEFDYTANATKASAGLVAGRTYKAEAIVDSAGAVTSTIWTEVETQTRLTAAQIVNIDVANDLIPATGGTTDTRVSWKAVATTAAYNFGDELVEENGVWTRGDTILVTAPALGDRILASEFDSMLTAGIHVTITPPATGSTQTEVEAVQVSWVNKSTGTTMGPVYVVNGTQLYVPDAGSHIEEIDPYEELLLSFSFQVTDDTNLIRLDAIIDPNTGNPYGIPADARSIYIEVASGIVCTTSLTASKISGRYRLPDRSAYDNTLEGILGFRLPNATEIATDQLIQLGIAGGLWTPGNPATLRINYSNRATPGANPVLQDNFTVMYQAFANGQFAALWGTTPIISIPFQPTQKRHRR